MLSHLSDLFRSGLEPCGLPWLVLTTHFPGKNLGTTGPFHIENTLTLPLCLPVIIRFHELYLGPTCNSQFLKVLGNAPDLGGKNANQTLSVFPMVLKIVSTNPCALKE